MQEESSLKILSSSPEIEKVFSINSLNSLNIPQIDPIEKIQKLIALKEQKALELGVPYQY